MDSNLQGKIYKEYFSALEKLTETQNKAREYFPTISLYPLKAPPDLSAKGREIYEQLNKAYKEYADKSRAWRSFQKTYGLK
jgi:hypothetical protein